MRRELTPSGHVGMLASIALAKLALHLAPRVPGASSAAASP